MAKVYDITEIIPSQQEIEKILKAKIAFEPVQSTPDRDAWNKANFTKTPWGISYMVCQAKYEKSKSKTTGEPTDVALRYFIISIFLEWEDLTNQLKRTLKNWGYSKEDMQYYADMWNDSKVIATINNSIRLAAAAISELDEHVSSEVLTEAIEKHETLNQKLFTKEATLKDRVRDKMLEIVDEFVDDLKEQDIEIKIDDIVLVGSNANYNYTKDSDIDLHIITRAKASKYEPAIANALYSAYRTLFNKKLDIKMFDIPLELYVELEDTPLNSNGKYSVKKNKWLKKPVQEEIPEYDKEALAELVNKWETKCKELIDHIKADKLEDENRVVKLIEDIYEKLRKKGIAKSEYAIENLAFKELRNKGYLDKLKDYRNELTSKRLSLEERLDRKARADVYNKLAIAANNNPPLIQDNGMFYIYNLKDSEVTQILQRIKNLPFIIEAFANTSGKYDFSDTLHIATSGMPKQYYNIRGQIDESKI